MNYSEWKQEYLELLIKLIKQHEYSKNYTQDYIDELWRTDYFEENIDGC